MIDTTPEVRQILIRKFHSLSPEQRLRKASNMFLTGKKFAELAVKKQRKELTGIDLKVAVFRWIYQKELSNEEMDKVELRMRSYHNKCKFMSNEDES